MYTTQGRWVLVSGSKSPAAAVIERIRNRHGHHCQHGTHVSRCPQYLSCCNHPAARDSRGIWLQLCEWKGVRTRGRHLRILARTSFIRRSGKSRRAPAWSGASCIAPSRDSPCPLPRRGCWHPTGAFPSSHKDPSSL